MQKIENNEIFLIAYQGKIDGNCYLDSGTSKHITSNKYFFSKLNEIEHGQV